MFFLKKTFSPQRTQCGAAATKILEYWKTPSSFPPFHYSIIPFLFISLRSLRALRFSHLKIGKRTVNRVPFPFSLCTEIRP
ncbi:MAG TPA: hypothetical protein VF372_10480, partial [Thermodesulfobacteriota bacterium]